VLICQKFGFCCRWHVFSPDISHWFLIICRNYFLILAPSRLSLAVCFINYYPLVMCCLFALLTLRPQGMCTPLLLLWRIAQCDWILLLLRACNCGCLFGILAQVAYLFFLAAAGLLLGWILFPAADTWCFWAVGCSFCTVPFPFMAQ